jgi:hypothetical protein
MIEELIKELREVAVVQITGQRKDDLALELTRLRGCERTLGILVELKDRKDRAGKDREYKEVQPIAWKSARMWLYPNE